MKITVEGHTGEGKSTLAVILTRALRAEGFQVTLTDLDGSEEVIAQSLKAKHAALLQGNPALEVVTKQALFPGKEQTLGTAVRENQKQTLLHCGTEMRLRSGGTFKAVRSTPYVASKLWTIDPPQNLIIGASLMVDGLWYDVTKRHDSMGITRFTIDTHRPA